MERQIAHAGTLRTHHRGLTLCVLLAALVVSACGERRQEVLPGVREGLRDVLETPQEEAAVENRTEPIRLATPVNNSEWAQFWGSPALRVAHPALSSAPQLAWSAGIGEGNSRRKRITADPVVGGGLVYTLDASTLVTATNASGATVWSRDLSDGLVDSDATTGGGLSYADGRLYVAVGVGALITLDARDGSTIWTQALDASASGAPTVSGDLVYLTAGDDTGWALEKETGRIRWQVGAGQNIGNILGAPPPTITSDLAIFAFGSGDVQAVFRRGGLRRWDASVLGERRGFAISEIGDVTAPPVVSGNSVFVGNQSGRIVALEIGNGDRLSGQFRKAPPARSGLQVARFSW